MRVDKWIWAVRMVKSRTLAGQMCKSGKVTVNGEKVKSSKDIKEADIVEVNHKSVIKRYEVVGFIEKRVSAELAAKNYIDHSPEVESPIDRDHNPDSQFWGQRIKGEGRPTKGDARKIRETKWNL